MNQVEAIDAKLRELRNTADDLRAAQEGTKAALSRVGSDISKLNAQRATALACVLTISDHAVLRYAERVLGLDLAEVRADLNGQIAALALPLGDGKYPVRCATGAVVGQAVVTNRTVVTILPV